MVFVPFHGTMLNFRRFIVASTCTAIAITNSIDRKQLAKCDATLPLRLHKCRWMFAHHHRLQRCTCILRLSASWPGLESPSASGNGRQSSLQRPSPPITGLSSDGNEGDQVAPTPLITTVVCIDGLMIYKTRLESAASSALQSCQETLSR